MARDSDPARQRIVLVTGLLGAGKTTALRALEDLGWETVDNFPVRLLERLLKTKPAEASEHPAPLALGFDARTRGFDPAAIIAQVEDLARRDDLALTTVFLDCADH
ncbi:MAG: RNase adapter RapZ, partial [Novosphingobium sp.]